MKDKSCLVQKAKIPMSSVIPKEKMTAFQRWEMTSFGDLRPSQIERAAAAEKITQTELNSIKEQARNEAYTAAYKEAYAAGYQEGHQEGLAAANLEMHEQASKILASLEPLTENYKDQLAKAHENIGRDLIGLAVELAEAMTKHKFAHESEAILEIVKESIDLLPAIHQPAQIFLHPDDLRLLKELMGAALEKDGWRLSADIHLSRGGCRIETAQNLIDATYETRWARLTEALNHPGNNGNAS
jgi:flagellar assembly protein FliH